MVTQAQCNSQTANALIVKPHKTAWWKEAVVYQIYPASFADSTGVSTNLAISDWTKRAYAALLVGHR